MVRRTMGEGLSLRCVGWKDDHLGASEDGESGAEESCAKENQGDL